MSARAIYHCFAMTHGAVFSSLIIGGMAFDGLLILLAVPFAVPWIVLTMCAEAEQRKTQHEH